MSCPNFARFFRLSRHYRHYVVARRRKWHGENSRGPAGPRFHQLATRRDPDLDLVDTTVVRDLVFPSLSRVDPRLENDRPAAWLVRRKEDEGQEGRLGILGDARETILILARIAIIGSVIVILLAAYLITRLTHSSLFPAILRRGIEFLGPIFVKFGQWMSTRRDVFPPDVCDVLSRLQRNATPHSWLHTERLLEATYGSSWRDLFVRFDGEGPIGSGCCAQVYKAWIDLNAMAGVAAARDPSASCFVENGAAVEEVESASARPPRPARKLQAVAVKVLHPGIEGQLKRDIAIMRGLCKCATYLVPELRWLSLADCVDEFAGLMEDQVDMRLEAANLARFSANFSGKSDIAFPRPYARLTGRAVLVETFHEGAPMSDYLQHEDAVLQRRLAKIGVATILKMIFKDNFIHCDLHPGNILVEVAPPRAGLFNAFRRVITPNYERPRLIILDCGLAVSLNDRCRRNLRDVFHSVLMGNGELAAQHILEHSSYATPDPDGFKRSMKNIVKSHLRNPLNVNATAVVTELFAAMVRYRVKQDGSFSGAILSVLVIEGLGRRLDPDIDIFAEMLPFVVGHTVYGD